MPGDDKTTKSENGLSISGRITIPQDDPVKTERTLYIQGLIQTVQDVDILKTDRLRMHKAVLRLGRMKALEAVPAIVERLDVHLNKYGIIGSGEVMPSRVHYPAIEALGQIGPAAMPYIVDSLVTKQRSEKFRSNALDALTAITGHRKKSEQYVRDRISFYERGSKLKLPLWKYWRCTGSKLAAAGGSLPCSIGATR